MSKKIEWFQEVLSLEPGSKVFFSLARLFVESERYEDAVTTLRKGLDRHPDFMEARLLLIQVLASLNREHEAVELLGGIVGPLRNYPAFWRLWAQSLPAEQRDFAVFLMLVASNLSGTPVRWMDVVLEGVNSLSARLVGPLKAPEAAPPATETEAVVRAPEPSLETIGPDIEPGSLRTRTMADLLASQGDFQGALEIYRDLWKKAEPGPTRKDLAGRIECLEADLKAAGGPAARSGGKADEDERDAFSLHAKNRLISTLETLAARFEARVRA
ncbi:MAG: tetratricopeptide repeat protein [Desulfovibrionaceae bacterium]|nr:tetratricopeptide repeat protein [Desulfovibrionaceae bacterium]